MNFKFSNKVDSKSVYRATLTDFLGVDFYNDATKISEQRAYDLQNLEFRDGTNQKRYGWKQQCDLRETHFTELEESYKVNGFWQFYDDSKVKHTIIHRGNKIVSFPYFPNMNIQIDLTESDVNNPRGFPSYSTQEEWDLKLTNQIKDERSFGVVRGERLYIFCGIYLVYGKWNDVWQLRIVQDNIDTYIPTTTIGISANESPINVRCVLDEVNMLSSKRKNKLIGESPNSELLLTNSKLELNVEKEFNVVFSSVKINFTYFSSETNEYKNVTIVRNIPKDSIIINGSGTVLEQLFNEQNSDFSFLGDLTDAEKQDIIANTMYYENIDTTLNKSKFKFNLEYENIRHINYIVVERDIELTYQLDSPFNFDSSFKVSYEKPNGIFDEVDSNDYVIDDINGVIVFNKNYEPLIEGQSNIIVEFVPLDNNIQEQADKINNCMFGCVFGYNEVEHLFISGNDDYPNMDWHTIDRDSSETNSLISEYEDFTYFGDLGYAKLGSQSTKIVGYSLLGDNTLAIHKEYSPNEPSMYIRTSYLANAVDISGNVVLDNTGNPYQKVYYNQIASAIGEGCITNNLNVNLLGDKLMLSQNGLFGIEINSNIKSNERYAKERSRMINNKLLKEPNLHLAHSIVFNNKLYLCVNDKVYLADARFKNQLKGEISDTFGYEWWIWSNIPSTIFFIVDNELWFGTKDGLLCKFIENYYEDYYLEHLPNGITKVSNTNEIVFDELSNLKEGDTIIQDFQELIADNSKKALNFEPCEHNGESYWKRCELTFDEYQLARFYSKGIKAIKGESVYNLDTVDVDLDETNGLYYLYTNNALGNINENTSVDAIVVQREKAKLMIKDNKYYLESLNPNIDEEDVYEIANIYSLDNSKNETFIERKTNVVSYWFSPILSFGVQEYKKRVKTLSIMFNPISNGVIDIGYKTYKVGKNTFLDNYNVKGATNANMFSDLDFNTFTFTLGDFTRNYTKQLRLNNINYLQLYYRSDNNENCVVLSMNLTYTLSKKNKGLG